MLTLRYFAASCVVSKLFDTGLLRFQVKKTETASSEAQCEKMPCRREILFSRQNLFGGGRGGS